MDDSNDDRDNHRQPPSRGRRHRQASIRVRCAICGKTSAGRRPRGGDGTFLFPRRHKGPDGEPCDGNVREADWITPTSLSSMTRSTPASSAAATEAAVVVRANLKPLPPVLTGHESPAIERQAESFYRSVEAMFEAWLRRTQNPNTQRAYRQDVMNFVDFLEIRWPHQAQGLLRVAVPDVQAWRDHLLHEKKAAPSTLNRRVASLSGFFRYMREAAAEARLPLVVPNPAHSQFIRREPAEPVEPTKALTTSRARQLPTLPRGDSVIAFRDRAILNFYLYTGARIGTGCRLLVEDFHQDELDPTLKIQEKGRGRAKRPLGIHFMLAEALEEYIERAHLTSGPLFRPSTSSRGNELASRPMTTRTMYRLIYNYLSRLPGAMREVELDDGSKVERCIYTPHSLRATTATLLLDAGVDIRDVQSLLGHKHVTVTQIYDKRRRSTRESASHRVSL